MMAMSSFMTSVMLLSQNFHLTCCLLVERMRIRWMNWWIVSWNQNFPSISIWFRLIYIVLQAMESQFLYGWSLVWYCVKTCLPTALFLCMEREYLSDECSFTSTFHSLFHLPLWVQAHEQYCLLLDHLQTRHMPNSEDKWSCIWGN